MLPLSIGPGKVAPSRPVGDPAQIDAGVAVAGRPQGQTHRHPGEQVGITATRPPADCDEECRGGNVIGRDRTGGDGGLEFRRHRGSRYRR